MNEAQETRVRSRITGWSVALGASLVVAYFYLILLLSALSSGRELFSLSFHWWLSISLVVAAVLHYFWFRRVAPELGGYRILAVIGIHVLGFLGAIVIFTILLVAAVFQI